MREENLHAGGKWDTMNFLDYLNKTKPTITTFVTGDSTIETCF